MSQNVLEDINEEVSEGVGNRDAPPKKKAVVNDCNRGEGNFMLLTIVHKRCFYCQDARDVLTKNFKLNTDDLFTLLFTNSKFFYDFQVVARI